jgi:hypothetical protein
LCGMTKRAYFERMCILRMTIQQVCTQHTNRQKFFCKEMYRSVR